MVADQLHFLIRHAIRSNAIVYVPLQAALREVEAGELVPLNLSCGDFEHRFIYAIVRRDQRRSPACDAFIAMLTSNFPKIRKGRRHHAETPEDGSGVKLDREVGLDRCVETQFVLGERGARVLPALLSPQLDEEIRGAVQNEVRFGETRRAGDVADHLDDPLDAVEIAQNRLHHSQMVERHQAGRSIAFLDG